MPNMPNMPNRPIMPNMPNMLPPPYRIYLKNVR